MLEIADRLLPLLAGTPVALATVARTEGASWPAAGTSLAVTAGGDVVGGLSAGCVELVALERCERLLRGVPGAAGCVRLPLGCDAEVELLVHLLGGRAARAEVAAAAAGRAARLGVLATGARGLVAGLEGAGAGGEVGDALLRSRTGVGVAQVRAALLSRPDPGVLEVDGAPVGRPPDGRAVRVLADVQDASPLFVVVGAGDLGAAVAAGATALGYRVVVVDHRPRLAVASRVPAASEVVCALAHEWLAAAPLDARSVVCLLSHDEDLDPPALAVALARGVAFVGALGSRTTHARRLERLAFLGVPERDARRVRGPLGLDIGSRAPAEQALSVLAEVVADRRGGSGRPLGEGSGPLHPR